ncbi:hypothetical protein IQ247_19160 [Plectonema cf. radiosum LEGE 06105]|uniref:Uncharacterized protein n=1 Tax=Plectonema cf. radiosum LEGE 06105 TaxID=945769 RepID=A0A8J7K2V4_9CYAN|nr:hypothetical protein [Plectonema radiosum]MBE9214762.1 hypothetical protein [Plectonema cf. radiosum LEGE 06105]
MHCQVESLIEDSEFILLNNMVFNANQIKNNIVTDFKPRENDLNFCRKNTFLKKYFREINNQGIFNRIEWKFWLKKDVECELMTFDKVKQVDKLQLRVILNFSSTLQIINNHTFDDLSDKENQNHEYFGLKVLLNYSLQELETEEKSTKIPTKINYIDTIAFPNINEQNNEQNTAYSYPLSSQKICI